MYFMNGGMLLRENVPILHVGGLELYRVASTHTWIASSPDSPIFPVNAACNIEMVGMRLRPSILGMCTHLACVCCKGCMYNIERLHIQSYTCGLCFTFDCFFCLNVFGL